MPAEFTRRQGKFHVVYWEPGDGGNGVDFDTAVSFASAIGKRPEKGPAICKDCSGVVDPWRHNFDIMHAAVRMLAKEGAGF